MLPMVYKYLHMLIYSNSYFLHSPFIFCSVFIFTSIFYIFHIPTCFRWIMITLEILGPSRTRYPVGDPAGQLFEHVDVDHGELNPGDHGHGDHDHGDVDQGDFNFGSVDHIDVDHAMVNFTMVLRAKYERHWAKIQQTNTNEKRSKAHMPNLFVLCKI